MSSAWDKANARKKNNAHPLTQNKKNYLENVSKMPSNAIVMNIKT